MGDRNGAQSVEALLNATRGPDGHRCTLTRLTEAWRRGDIVPDPTEQEQQAIGVYLVPAVNVLINEALTRAGVTREDMREEGIRQGYLRAKAEPGR